MILISFMSMIEEALLDREGEYRLSGNVTDIERLLTDEAMQALEKAHDGYFAFLAFDPSVDVAVSDYVSQGSLPADSGRYALILFTVEESPALTWSFPSKALSMITVSEQADLPALVALRYLFGDKAPTLPGLAVFSSFSQDADVLYFEFSENMDSGDIRASLRAVIEISNKAWQQCGGSRIKFANTLAAMSQRSRLSFFRSGRRSMLQWLIQMCQWLNRHRGEIIAVVGLALK